MFFLLVGLMIGAALLCLQLPKFIDLSEIFMKKQNLQKIEEIIQSA